LSFKRYQYPSANGITFLNLSIEADKGEANSICLVINIC
jgi:hypothetical protein